MMTEKAELISKVKQQEQERSRLQQEAAAAAKEQRVLLQQVARSMPTAADMKRKRNLEKRQAKDSTVSTLLVSCTHMHACTSHIFKMLLNLHKSKTK